MPTVLLQVDAKSNAAGVLAKVERALAGLERAMHGVNAAAAGGILDAQISAMGKLAGSADASAGAIARMTRSYRDMEAAANAAARAAGKVHGSGGGSSGGSGGGSTGSGGGSSESGKRGLFSGSAGALATGAGYYGAYLVGSQITDSFGRSAAFSRTMGSTQAETDLKPAEAARLRDRITAMSGSGGLPYDRDTLAQGAYSLASLGVGQNTGDFGGSVAAIVGNTAKMSAAAGAPDTAAANDAVVSVMADFGLNNKNAVGNAATVADQLQVATKYGKAELPQFASQVALPSALGSQLGLNSGQILGFMSAESAGGMRSTDLADPFNSLLDSSMVQTRTRQKAAKGLGIQYDASFWGKNGLAGGMQKIESAMDSRGLSRGQRLQTETALFGETGVLAYETAKKGGLANITSQVMHSKGAVNSAYETSQMASGAKLVDAETKLKTSLDSLSDKALPAVVEALGTLAKGLDTITHWGDKTKPNPAGGTPLDTVAQIFQGKNPLTGEAQDAAARRRAGNGDSVPFLGGLMEIGGRVDSMVHGVNNALPRGVAGALGVSQDPQKQAAAITGGVLGGLGTKAPAAWSYQMAANRGHRDGDGLGMGGAAYTGLKGADWARNYLVAGQAGAGNKDADMQTNEGNLTLAIWQHQSASAVQSALGLAIQSINQNANLTDTQKSLDIMKEQKEAAKYLGAAAATAATTPFHTNNPGIGGLEAGFGATVARAGGGRNPTESAVAKLQHALDVANGKNAQLLQEIRDLLARGGSAPTARQSLLAGTGTNRMVAK